MRSRYTAFVRRDENHLFRTWHREDPTRRPRRRRSDTEWRGLEILGTPPDGGSRRCHGNGALPCEIPGPPRRPCARGELLVRPPRRTMDVLRRARELTGTVSILVTSAHPTPSRGRGPSTSTARRRGERSSDESGTVRFLTRFRAGRDLVEEGTDTMTKDKDFKKLVRSRMTATGENFTTARANPARLGQQRDEHRRSECGRSHRPERLKIPHQDAASTFMPVGPDHCHPDEAPSPRRPPHRGRGDLGCGPDRMTRRPSTSILADFHPDFALLRRELIDYRLLERNSHTGRYWVNPNPSTPTGSAGAGDGRFRGISALSSATAYP
jgi:hypothetical protein